MNFTPDRRTCESMRARLWLPVLLLLSLAAVFGAVAVHADTSPALDNLLSRLPKPESFSKSPLQTALKDPDPILQDPEFRHFVAALRKGDAKGALATVRVLSAKYSGKSVVHFLHGLLALELGLHAEAENEFRQTVSLDPKAVGGWHWLALSQAAQKHFPEAIASARQAVQLAPNSAANWIMLSAVESRAGRSQDAVSSAQHATQIAPASALGWVMLGAIYANEKRFPDAVRSYKRALNLAPGDTYVTESVGICFALNNQPAEAIPPLRAVVNRNPKAYHVATLLAACYLRTGKPAEGSVSCRQALAAKGDYAPAWKLLGACCTQQGKSREAAAAYEKELKFAPNDTDARNRLVAITARR